MSLLIDQTNDHLVKMKHCELLQTTKENDEKFRDLFTIEMFRKLFLIDDRIIIQTKINKLLKNDFLYVEKNITKFVFLLLLDLDSQQVAIFS
jgi:hypothetical protein